MEWPVEFKGHDFEFYGNEGWFRLKIYDNQPPKKAGIYAVGRSPEECIAEALRKLKLDRDEPEQE